MLQSIDLIREICNPQKTNTRKGIYAKMNTSKNTIMLKLESKAKIIVNSYIAPIEHTLSHFHKDWDTLANLRVAEPEKEQPLSVFQAFLPSEAVSVGECWQPKSEGITALLQQFHPTTELLDTHTPTGYAPGLWACLRAYNDSYADIAFRIHATFNFEDGRLTPSQFKGNLIIDRSDERVSYFKMYVPEGPVNLDIVWYEDEDKQSGITDAGLCTQMELWSGIEDPTNNIKYTESITQEESEQELILRFYESEQINWVPPERAIELAEEQVKLIHVISIDGPLHDESC